jgi:hypothetical protein
VVTVDSALGELALLPALSELSADALESSALAELLEEATSAEAALSEELPSPPPDEELVAEHPQAARAKATNAATQIAAIGPLVSFDIMRLPHMSL